MITHFEDNANEVYNTAKLYRGWFVPPATTNYRFYNSCDDHCALRLGTHPD